MRQKPGPRIHLWSFVPAEADIAHRLLRFGQHDKAQHSSHVRRVTAEELSLAMSSTGCCDGCGSCEVLSCESSNSSL